MKPKSYILSFLLLVTMVMVIAPAIPHHHHGAGVICMKDDIKEEGCCSHDKHQHHHSEDDPCCTEQCSAHFTSSIPHAKAVDAGPDFQYILILFTKPLISVLTQPDERRTCLDIAYSEPLYSTFIACAAGLRAPPAC